MPAAIEQKEREAIAETLSTGVSVGETAKRHKRSKGAVSKIAQQHGIVFERSNTKKASQAKRDYALAERIELLNDGFDKARELLAGITEVKDLQAWMISVGTGIDKRRLEDGEATSRDERHNHDHKAELDSYFKDLDVYRRTHSTADTDEPVGALTSN